MELNMKAFLYNYTFNDLIDFKIDESMTKHYALVNFENIIRRYYLEDTQGDMTKRYYILAETNIGKFVIGFCVYAIKDSDNHSEDSLHIYSSEIFDDVDAAKIAFEKLLTWN